MAISNQELFTSSSRKFVVPLSAHRSKIVNKLCFELFRADCSLQGPREQLLKDGVV